MSLLGTRRTSQESDGDGGELTSGFDPRAWNSRDLLAGFTVALVLLPQSLAYAEIAGVPPAVGLAAAALPPLLAAFFASSPYLQTGPVALTSLLTFGALQGLAPTGSAEYVALAALLAIVVGVTRVVLGLVRGGIVAYSMTEPVVLGFTTGAAILIIGSQLPTMFGLERGDRGVLSGDWFTLTHPDLWSMEAIVLSILTVGFILGARRVHRLFPAVLVVVIVTIVWSSTTDYSGATIGELPGGFVSLSFDLPWESLGALIVPGVIIALVGYAEPASIARTFATDDRIPWDSNRELVSQGVANLASGLAGGFPVGGSFSRSALNRLAGAQSVVAGGVTGAIILAFQPLTPMLEPLPKAVLGAIVLVAVLKLIKVGEMVALVRAAPRQAVVAWLTLGATLATAPKVERGVVIGVMAAAAVFVCTQMCEDGVRSPKTIIRNALASSELR